MTQPTASFWSTESPGSRLPKSGRRELLGTTDRHHVKIVRNIKDGLIQVYFDDMQSPVMATHDKTFTHGRFGVGSFDDTGMFDEIRIWGK